MLSAARLAENEIWVAALAGALVLVALFGYVAWRRYNAPAARERRRRLRVNAHGRLTDGTVTDFEADRKEKGAALGLIYYTYSIGGVEYSTAQDVSTLVQQVGSDPSGIVGAVKVKYHSRNPFNSIVVCEDWSGLGAGRSGSKDA